MTDIDWPTLDKEFTEAAKKLKEGRKMVDEAFDVVWRIWGICSKNSDSFCKYWNAKQSSNVDESTSVPDSSKEGDQK